jgi:S1-C subfamily serine protease
MGKCAANAVRNAAAQAHDAQPVAAQAAIPAPLPPNDPAFDYATGLSKVFRNAADRVLPAVVTIQHSTAVESQSNISPHGNNDENGGAAPFGGDLFNDPLFKRFFGDNLPNTPRKPFPDTPQGSQVSMGRKSNRASARPRGPSNWRRWESWQRAWPTNCEIL